MSNRKTGTGRSSEIAFGTSNAHKLKEANIILAKFGLTAKGFDGKGIEIQSDSLKEIAEYASRAACLKCGGPAIVEDSGIFVESLNGFPGPYSSYVFRTLGLEAFLRLVDGQRSRDALFKSAVAYCEPGKEPLSFEGTLKGVVTRGIVGGNGFGFDPVFAPIGSSKTLAEMTLEEKCEMSHRARSMGMFAEWYRSR